jgi:hypothetical protein
MPAAAAAAEAPAVEAATAEAGERRGDECRSVEEDCPGGCR